jgi:ABC-type transporter MlaC component
MTNIEVEVEQRLTDESSDDEQQEETVQDNVEVPTPKAEVDNILNNISSKAVKQLSRDERSKLISDFENGVENQYFKVMKMKNGQIRITKRFNPLPTPDKAPEVINNKIN